MNENDIGIQNTGAQFAVLFEIIDSMLEKHDSYLVFTYLWE